MSSLDERLLDVFQVAFPDAPADDLPNATSEGMEDWDSLATVTLVTLLQEEFDLDIPPEEAMTMLSYAAFRNYLASRVE